MRLLLDTHVLVWALAEPRRLSTAGAAAIEDRTNEVWVSAASAWELAAKYRLGKLAQAEALVQGYPEHLERLGAHELAVTSRHALAAGSLSWKHRDPFDRMLAVQAMVESAVLVTADPAFTEVPGVGVLW